MEHSDGCATSVVLNIFLSNEHGYEGGDFYIKVWEQGHTHTRSRPGQYSPWSFWEEPTITASTRLWVASVKP